MTKTLGAPDLYVQGPGEMSRLQNYVSRLGKTALVVAEMQIMTEMQGPLDKTFREVGTSIDWEKFGGMCTSAEIDRLSNVVEEGSYDVVIGVGGGRALDAARAAAALHRLPLVAVPTVAATGAACSSVSVVTEKNGVVRETQAFGAHAAVVVVDSALVARQSPRSLVAGMGGGIAAWLGARSQHQKGMPVVSGGQESLSAYAVARTGYDVILADGLRALVAAQNGMSTPAFESVLEANILCSGIAFENGGSAVAFGVANALTLLPPARAFYAGELAAFGSIVQLILEDVPRTEMDDIMNFFLSTGLPMTFEDLGLAHISSASLKKVAAAACLSGSPEPATQLGASQDDILGALLAASVTGHLYQEEEEGHADHEGDEEG